MHGSKSEAEGTNDEICNTSRGRFSSPSQSISSCRESLTEQRLDHTRDIDSAALLSFDKER